MWQTYPSSAGRDALATCIRAQEASAATRREVIDTSRMMKRTAVRPEDGVRLVSGSPAGFLLGAANVRARTFAPRPAGTIANLRHPEGIANLKHRAQCLRGLVPEFDLDLGTPH